MNLTNDLPTSKDYLESLPQTTMADKRNFNRPKETWGGSTLPTDISLADDQDFLIEQIQKTLQVGLLGAKYVGPIDGKINSSLLNAISQFEQALESKLPGQKFIGTIRYGTMIGGVGWNKAMKALATIKKEEPKAEKLDEKTKEVPDVDQKNSQIIEFQKYFGLPQTGIIDDKLVQIAKNTEAEMIKNLQEPALKGMFWDDINKQFKTNVGDLQSAQKLIMQNKQK